MNRFGGMDLRKVIASYSSVLYTYLSAIAYFAAISSSSESDAKSLLEARIKIVHPVNGAPWYSGMPVFVDLDLWSAESIRAEPDMYVVCAAGDLEGIGAVGGGIPNCSPLQDDGVRSSVNGPLFSRLFVAKPRTVRGTGGGGVSEVRVWVQHFSHLRHPSSARGGASRAVVFVLNSFANHMNESEKTRHAFHDNIQSTTNTIGELEKKRTMASCSHMPSSSVFSRGGDPWVSWSAALALDGLGREDLPSLLSALAASHIAAGDEISTSTEHEQSSRDFDGHMVEDADENKNVPGACGSEDFEEMMPTSSLFPCSMPDNKFVDGAVALRLHLERPSTFPFDGGVDNAKGEGGELSSTHPRYEYLAVNLPLAPRIPWIYSLNDARQLIAPHLREACAGAGLHSPEWVVDDCTLDLLEQITERIIFICTSPAKAPDSCTSKPSVNKDDRQHTDSGADGVDLTLAKKCLGLTHRSASDDDQKHPPKWREGFGSLDVESLKYPEDAEDHLEEIQQALRPWSSLRPGHRPHHAAGFGGPWIENAWCASAYSNDDSPASSLGRASAAKPLRSWEVISGVASGSWRSSWSPPQRTLCLREMFGPFIPVLLPWTDLWEPESMHRLPPDLVPTLRRILRLTVPYVTVVQHDSGLALACENSLHALFPNLMVFSAGGFGHIPIPLLKQPELQNNFRPFSSSLSLPEMAAGAREVRAAEVVSEIVKAELQVDEVTTNNTGDPESEMKLRIKTIATAAPRTHLVSYVGSSKNAPFDLRFRVLLAINSTASKLNQSAVYYQGKRWRDVMADSRFSLCPRGVGRTSYHLIETLQMGLIPIHVHEDEEQRRYHAKYEAGGELGGSSENEMWEWEQGIESWVPYELNVFRERDENKNETTSENTLRRGTNLKGSGGLGLGWSTSISKLPSLLQRLAKISSSSVREDSVSNNKLSALEAEVLSLKSSHFSTYGVLEQIRGFLTSSRVEIHYRRWRRISKEAKDDNDDETYGSWEEDQHGGMWRVSTVGSDLICRALPVYPNVGEASLASLSDDLFGKMRPGWDYGFCHQWNKAHFWEQMT